MFRRGQGGSMVAVARGPAASLVIQQLAPCQEKLDVNAAAIFSVNPLACSEEEPKEERATTS